MPWTSCAAAVVEDPQGALPHRRGQRDEDAVVGDAHPPAFGVDRGRVADLVRAQRHPAVAARPPRRGLRQLLALVIAMFVGLIVTLTITLAWKCPSMLPSQPAPRSS